MMVTNKTCYAELVLNTREIPLNTQMSNYEWEKLVQKLCAPGDAGLRDIGVKELYELLHRLPARGGV